MKFRSLLILRARKREQVTVPKDQVEDASAAFRTDVVRHAYEYWAGKRRGGGLPRRADIDPLELRQLLPFLFLVDVHRDPIGFRFRLVGTAITQCAGMDHTGRWVNERDYGPEWKRIYDAYFEVVRTGAPKVEVCHAAWPARNFVHYERLAAPLATDGNNVDMLFGALKSFPFSHACLQTGCAGACP